MAQQISLVLDAIRGVLRRRRKPFAERLAEYQERCRRGAEALSGVTPMMRGTRDSASVSSHDHAAP